MKKVQYQFRDYSLNVDAESHPFEKHNSRF